MKKTLYFIVFLVGLTSIISCEPGRDESGDLLFGLEDSLRTRGSSDTLKNLKKPLGKQDSLKPATLNYKTK